MKHRTYEDQKAEDREAEQGWKIEGCENEIERVDWIDRRREGMNVTEVSMFRDIS